MHRMNHLPSFPWLLHYTAMSGLGELSSHYSEKAAIRVMTRRDMFKFTFVRNPFGRLLSVAMESGQFQHLYSHLCFLRLPPPVQWLFRGSASLKRLRRQSDAFLTFPDFVRLVEEQLEDRRAYVEPHIAPQVQQGVPLYTDPHKA